MGNNFVYTQSSKYYVTSRTWNHLQSFLTMEQKFIGTFDSCGWESAFIQIPYGSIWLPCCHQRSTEFHISRWHIKRDSLSRIEWKLIGFFLQMKILVPSWPCLVLDVVDPSKKTIHQREAITKFNLLFISLSMQFFILRQWLCIYILRAFHI